VVKEVSVVKEAQQKQKQVDKIQVQREGLEDGGFVARFPAFCHANENNLLELLRVVGDQGSKENNADKRRSEL
jgi:hypothetical protein